MKRIIHLLTFIFLANLTLLAQENARQGINYQAVARTTEGQVMPNQEISLKVVLRKGGPDGKKVFVEIHQIKTNQLGLFSLTIGQGNAGKGVLEEVPWSESEIWMELNIDETGGSNFKAIHSTRLMAVPYAFHALTANELTSNPMTKSSRATGLPFWTLIGNNNIDVENRDHFIGTRDSVDFVFKTNSLQRMVIQADGTLIFLGDVFFESNLDIGENLSVGQDATIGNNLQVDSSATVNVDLTIIQDLYVGRDAFIGRDLEVDSNATIQQDLFVRDSLQVDNNANIGLDLNVDRDVSIGRDMQVDSNATIQQNLFVRDSLQVDNNTNIGKDVTIGGNLSVGDKLQVDSSANIGFDLNVGRDLNVIENVMVDRNIQVDTNAVIGFDLYVRDSLQVDSNANIGFNLNVGQIATIDQLLYTRDSLQVDSSANIGLDVNVGRIAMVNDLVHTKDSLQVDSSANIGLDVTIGRHLFVRDSLQVDSSANIGLDLNIGRNAIVKDLLHTKDSLLVDSIAIVGKYLFVEDSLGINGRMGITQNLTVGALSTLDTVHLNKGATIDGTLRVSGKTEQIGLLDVRNDAVIGKTLSVTGDIIGNANATVDTLFSRKSIIIEDGNLLAKNNVNVLERFSVGALDGLPSNTGFFINADAQKFDFPFRMQVIDSGYVFSVGKQGEILSKSGKRGIPTPGEFGDFGDKYGFWLNSRDQGLYLQLSQPFLEETNNFISFADSLGTELGKIASDEFGEGITYTSSNGDYAEWLERSNHKEELSYGDIVGVRGGKISKRLTEADHFMVISRSPIVLGNKPPTEEEDQYEKVGFIGQVPVKVEGAVKIGDYILPCGRNDGVGRAVSPHQMRLTDYKMIVGVAWEKSSATAIKYINTAIGINTNDLSAVIAQQQAELDKLNASVAEIRQVLGLDTTEKEENTASNKLDK